ncbi:MAG TPA: glycosyltransferase [Myxococcales bacterium LLY-WYZ-16_1]|nr:glycosyltransferase [Myxococcales bacterium LLY-WYZ-16_1]
MIPAVAHFIWFGSTFPWVNLLAVRSAAERGGFCRLVLHHDGAAVTAPHFRALEELPGFESRRIDLRATLKGVLQHGDIRQLIALFDTLEAPSARANLVRAAILAAEGGVYLDMDTVTRAPLTPLRDAAAFCGVEPIVFPAVAVRSRNPASWARAGALHVARDLCRTIPGGWRPFRAIQSWYPWAANNAVLACRPEHELAIGLLHDMLALPRARWGVRYALGTHLLQDRLGRSPPEDVRIHPPPAFYPLPPEISQHWFRRTPGARTKLRKVLSQDTRVVHWYASVRTKKLVPRLDPDYVRLHADRQLFSALAEPFV